MKRDFFQGASPETLAYYGASMIESSRETITLEERHAIQDFNYSEDYLTRYVMDLGPDGGGGSSLEHHDFAHMDCPLTPMKKSGHFILAKFLNQEKTTIALTGFQVWSEQ